MTTRIRQDPRTRDFSCFGRWGQWVWYTRLKGTIGRKGSTGTMGSTGLKGMMGPGTMTGVVGMMGLIGTMGMTGQDNGADGHNRVTL